MNEEASVPGMLPNLDQSDENKSVPTSQSSLQNKLRIGETEEVLLTRRCSVFAFMWMYMVGIFILVIHLFFGHDWNTSDAEWYEWIFFKFVEISTWQDGFGFAFVMVFFTWLNRVINHPASGGWVTTYLLLISLTPLIINIDSFLEFVGLTDQTYIPFGYDVTIAGIFWSVLFICLTFWYQKSFLYAVTTERVIHYQSFIYERDGHRILHEDILAVHKKRSPLGALFGYATIYCNIGDSSHISTETVGGAIAIPAASSGGSDNESKSGGGILNMIRSLILVFTYQRTIRTERFTPEVSWYGIRHWEEAFDLINRLHHENSTATKLEEQVAVQKQMVELLTQAQELKSEDLPGMDDLLDL